jgi:AraC family transcriptional regulator
MAGTGVGMPKIDGMVDELAWMRALRCEPLDHGLACYPPGTTIGPRRVTAWQFVWLARGDATWEVDGCEQTVREGGVLLARPGMRDLLRWDPVRRTFHGWISFRLRGSPPHDLTMVRQPGADDILLPLLRHARRLMGDRAPGWETLAAGALRQALLVFATGNAGCDQEDADDTPALVDHALEWLARRWEDGPLHAPTLTAWSHACGVTREALIRAFRASYGETPMAAVRLLRLDRAAQLLTRSATVQEAAAATGFASPFHFSRRFTAVYGCPPSAFRGRIAAGGGHGHVRLVKVRTLASRLWRTR